MLYWIISPLSSTLTDWNRSTSRVVTLLPICLNSRLRSIWPTTRSSKFLPISFISMLDILTLNILKIDLLIFLLIIKHIVFIFLSIWIVTLSSFVSIYLSVWHLWSLIIVRFPSRISLVFSAVFLFSFILFNLAFVKVIVYFIWIFGLNIWIGTLFSSVMESILLLLLIIFKLLLCLSIKVNFNIIILFHLLLAFIHIIVLLSFSIIVFDLTCNFSMINTFKFLFDVLFAIYAIKSILNIIWC